MGGGQLTADGTTRVFVSYRREMKNRIFVDLVLREKLAEHGIDCWIDSDDLNGQHWEQSAKKAMNSCASHVLIVDESVLSPRLSDSGSDPIAMEVAWAKEAGLKTVYLAVYDSDRIDFLQNVDEVPPENVLCVMGDRDRWLSKLVSTFDDVAAFAYPGPVAWAAVRSDAQIETLTIDESGVIRAHPRSNPTVGMALASNGIGLGRVQGLALTMYTLGIDGRVVSERPIVLGCAEDERPIAVHWDSLLGLVGVFAGASSWSSWKIDYSKGATTLISTELAVIRDAAWFAGGLVTISEDLRLSGGPASLLDASDQLRWLSIDSGKAGQAEILAALSQSGSARSLHVIMGTANGQQRVLVRSAPGAISARVMYGSNDAVEVAVLTATAVHTERFSFDGEV